LSSSGKNPNRDLGFFILKYYKESRQELVECYSSAAAYFECFQEVLEGGKTSGPRAVEYALGLLNRIMQTAPNLQLTYQQVWDRLLSKSSNLREALEYRRLPQKLCKAFSNKNVGLRRFVEKNMILPSPNELFGWKYSPPKNKKLTQPKNSGGKKTKNKPKKQQSLRFNKAKIKKQAPLTALRDEGKKEAVAKPERKVVEKEAEKAITPNFAYSYHPRLKPFLEGGERSKDLADGHNAFTKELEDQLLLRGMQTTWENPRGIKDIMFYMPGEIKHGSEVKRGFFICTFTSIDGQLVMYHRCWHHQDFVFPQGEKFSLKGFTEEMCRVMQEKSQELWKEHNFPPLQSRKPSQKQTKVSSRLGVIELKDSANSRIFTLYDIRQ
jgi:hypothetical protein